MRFQETKCLLLKFLKILTFLKLEFKLDKNLILILKIKHLLTFRTLWGYDELNILLKHFIFSFLTQKF